MRGNDGGRPDGRRDDGWRPDGGRPDGWLPRLGLALAGLLLAVLSGGGLPAHAQPPALFSAVEVVPTDQAATAFSALEPAADLAEPLTTDPSATPGPPVLRQRFVELDLALLDTVRADVKAAGTAEAGVMHAAGLTAPRTLTFNLFADAAFPALVTTVEATYSGGYALSGQLDGEPLSTFTLVVNDTQVAGSVLTPEDHYEIDTLDPGLPGVATIRQRDPTGPSEECEAHEPDPLPASELAILPPAPDVSPAEVAPTSSASPTVIDIAVFYTPLAKSGRWNIESHIDNIVAATNQAFSDSNVNQRLRLVHRAQIAYVESGSLSTDRSRLRYWSDGYMTEVHGIRDTVGADLVHLLVAKSNSGVCGAAYIMTQVNSSFAGRAFATHHYYCSANSFAHEVGHNLGLQHDRYVNKSNSPQPCAHGYVNREGLKSGAGQWARWRTLMAYPHHCSAVGVSCARIRRFSNANQTWHGHPLGIAGCQSSNSVDGPAHAWETLANTAGTVAAFRDSTPSFGSQTLANRSYPQNEIIATLTLPVANRGDGSLSYTLTPATLPTGLSFDSSTRTLTGTPTTLQSAQNYTYTATDTDNDTASLTFSIAIAADTSPSFGNQMIANKTYTKDLPIPSLALPAPTGGNAPLTYTVSPLPTGLAFDTTTRTLSGTPTATQTAQTATYTVSDLDTDTASLPFTVAVEAIGLTTTVGDRQVTLGWSAGADSATAITQWEYQQGSGEWTTIPNSAQQTTGSHTVTGLTNGRAYTFTVRAVNTQGNAESVSVTATPATTPAQPTGLTATADDQQVTLTWTAPTNTGGEDLIPYQVSQDNGTSWTGTGSTTTSHTVTGLTNGTAYTFKVRAANARGAGAESEAVTATPATTPAKPINFTATAGHHQVTLEWTSGGDGGAAITEWRYSWDDGAHWGTTGSTATRYSVYLPTNGTAYTFKVRAVNAWGVGPPSDAAPATPRGFEATAGDGQVRLDWRALPANAEVDGWEYRQREGSGEYGAWTPIPDSNASTRSYTVRNLTNGQEYTFQVRAKDSQGTIVERVEFPAVTPEPATPPGRGGTDGPSGGGGGGGGGGGSADPDDVHGDTPATATRVRVGSSTPGQLHAPTDRDYFSLTVPQAGLLVVETTGTTDTQGTLTTPDGRLFVQTATGGSAHNFQITHRVAAGPYLVAVTGTGTGGYRLVVDLLVGFVDNPQPHSAQSGIGVLSGWVCEAETVEVELNGVLHQAAYGTERTDTEPYCGDTNNGFGLLYNWNKLGDGAHTVRVVVDGIEFATLPVRVTTLGLGEEFPRGLTGESLLVDFPTNGESVRLEWQEAQQNFTLAAGPVTQNGTTRDWTWAVLENPAPGSYQSGVRVISGWVCEAEEVVVEIDGTHRLGAAYGTERADTAEPCGDMNNGFGLLWNWNKLADGLHTMRLLVDGEEWATATFTVTTLGEEFRRGLAHTAVVRDFPGVGQAVTVEWQEAQQNFVVTGVD